MASGQPSFLTGFEDRQMLNLAGLDHSQKICTSWLTVHENLSGSLGGMGVSWSPSSKGQGTQCKFRQSNANLGKLVTFFLFLTKISSSSEYCMNNVFQTFS